MTATDQARKAGVVARFLATAGPELALLTVMALWSSTYVVTKDTLEDIPALAFISIRFFFLILLAFGVLLIQARGRGRASARDDLAIRRADLGPFLLASLTGYVLYQLGFVLGVERTSAFSAALLIALVPVFTLIILALRGEPTTLWAWAGVGLAVLGVAIFLLDKRGERESSLLGDLLCLGAGVSFAVYGLVNRPITLRYPPATYSAYALLVGGVPLVLLGLPATLALDWGSLSVKSWVAIAYMVVFPVYIAYQLFNWAISRRGAAQASSFTLLTPILGGVLSALLLDESFGPAKLLGSALVLGGLVVMRRR